MMTRRATLFRLCQRIVSSNGPITSHTLPRQVTTVNNYDASYQSSSIKCFGTSARSFKSTRVISDEFDDSVFKEFDEVDNDFYVEPVTKKGVFRSNRTEPQEDNRAKPLRWTTDPENPRVRPNPKLRENRAKFTDSYESEDTDNFSSHSRSDRYQKRGDNDRYNPRGDNDRYNPRGNNERYSNDRYNNRGSSDRYSNDRYSQSGNNDRYSQRDSGDRYGQRDSTERGSMEDLWDTINEKKTDFDNMNTIDKNVYNEHPDVVNRPQEEIREFMEEHQMTIRGKNKKNPILNFQETSFPTEISEILKHMKFDQPTPIQSIGWPYALSGDNIVGIAQTGSGKTLSFILPAIIHILQRKKVSPGPGGPKALVMCPTRELAIQCHEVMRKFSGPCRIKSAVVYGGQSKFIQAEQLIRNDLDIVIATPGRLLDFLSTDTTSVRDCSFLVLDEADRMLDMGFEPQIRMIMNQIRPDRQVLMWSATWPEEIQDLASDFLKEYVHVKIGKLGHAVNADITHKFHYCNPREKIEILVNHLRENPHPTNPRKTSKTLIFCSTKSMCRRLNGILREEGFYSDSIHGDKSQSQRDNVMHRFRTNNISVMVASEIAARGLDVTDIEYVINFDVPPNIDSYVHRVGRTGRAGKKGTAINFMTVENLDIVRPIIKVLEDVGHEVPDILHQLLEKKSKLNAYKKQGRRESNFQRPRRY